MRHLVLITLSMIGLILAGCSTNPKVERVDAESVADLSGAWNDTDSRLVAEEMINDALAHVWITNHTQQTGERPTVIVGAVRNNSHEHINVGIFTSDIERALINSGRVDFVASSEERQDIRAERIDQDLNATERTRNQAGQEQGADYMLKGSVNSNVDTVKGRQSRFYQVNMDLISLADNRKVWVGQKEIKKDIKRPLVRY